jgi:hypothetical protein
LESFKRLGGPQGRRFAGVPELRAVLVRILRLENAFGLNLGHRQVLLDQIVHFVVHGRTPFTIGAVFALCRYLSAQVGIRLRQAAAEKGWSEYDFDAAYSAFDQAFDVKDLVYGRYPDLTILAGDPPD